MIQTGWATARRMVHAARTDRGARVGMPNAKRLARAVSWNAAGTVLARLLTLGSSIIIGRTLGVAGLGTIGVLQQTVTLLATITVFGLPTALTTDLASTRQHAPHRAGSLIGAALLGAAFTTTLAALALSAGDVAMAERVLGVPTLVHALPAAALLVVSQGIFTLQLGALGGLERFRSVAIATIFAGAAALAGSAIGGRADGTTGAIRGLAAGSVLAAVVTHVMLTSACRDLGSPLTVRGARTSLLALWQTARAATLTNLLVVGTTWFVSVTLAKQPGGAAAVGLLTIGMQWRAAVLAIPLTASAPLLSILSSMQHDGAARRRIGGAASAVAGGLALLGAVAVGVATPLLVRAYGDGFSRAVPVVWLLIASAVPLAVAGMLGQLTLSRGDRRTAVASCVAWSAALAIGAVLLTPRFGATGAALATLLAAPVQVAILWKRDLPGAA